MADVTVKLTGEQYRVLCIEVEYHAEALTALARTMPPSADRTAAIKRAVMFQEVIEKVQQ